MEISDREKVILRYVEEQAKYKWEQFNELCSDATCGISSGEMDDGIAQLHNRIEKELRAIPDAQAAKYRACVEALKACTLIKGKIESIEHYEEWTDGTPTLGTCRLFADIKRTIAVADAALAGLEG